MSYLNTEKPTIFGVAVLVILLGATLGPLQAQEQRHNGSSPWEHSIVTLEVARKQYDFYQPWTKRTSRTQKTGLVIDGGQILTTADEMFDRTLVRLQKNGRGRWWIGEVTWIDYYANLALVTTSETNFWRDLKPASLAGSISEQDPLQILRWREGNLENRHAEFMQFAVRESQLAPVNHVVLETDSDIQNAGSSEIISANSHVAGLVSAQAGRTCSAIPASFIQDILQARQNQTYHGLGFFHFYWQPAQNPASLAHLKLTGDPRGVIVTSVPERPDDRPQVLKTNDIILRIDGFDLDIQGDYEDPEYGHLMLENLATRRKWAGDNLPMQIWRDGKTMEVTYQLPKYDYNVPLVPFATYDHEPEYLILGGLVFQPLTDPYLQSWGNDWRRRSPFRLYYYRNDQRTKERQGLLLLSQVLPDAYNIGYQEQRWLVVDRVNGKPVSRLEELREALQKPVDGYHIIDFVQSDSLRRVVLDAGELEKAATERVLKRYGINEPFHFATDTN